MDCRCRTIRSSTPRILRSLPAKTNSFCVSKRKTLCSAWMRAGNFWSRSIRFPWWRWKINASVQFCRQFSLAKFAALAVLVVSIAGCRQDMHNQPKYIPLRSGMFFADGRSARLQVPGTVARGQLHEDTYYYTGKINGVEGDTLPL